MFTPQTQATLVIADPPRLSSLALWERTTPDALPDSDSHGTTEISIVVPTSTGVTVQTHSARFVPIPLVLSELAHRPLGDPRLSQSVTAWGAVVHSALASIACGALQPRISSSGHDMWVAASLLPETQSAITSLAAWLPVEAFAHNVATSPDDAPLIVDPRHAVEHMFHAVADTLPRTLAGPTASGIRAWADAGLDYLPHLAAEFPTEEDSAEVVVGLMVHLPVSSTDVATLELYVRNLESPDETIPAAEFWQGNHTDLPHNTGEQILRVLSRASRVWPACEELLWVQHPTSMTCSVDVASELIGVTALELGQAGLEVRVPRDLTKQIRTTAIIQEPEEIRTSRTRLHLDAISTLEWRAELDGEPLSTDELSLLAQSHKGLVRLRDSWVIVDPTTIKNLHNPTPVSAGELLQAALTGELVIDGVAVDSSVVDLQLPSPIQQLAHQLQESTTVREIEQPNGLHATLRPYQQRGVAWLSHMWDLGIGGVLADDMGLGKTIQVIAAYLHQRTQHQIQTPMLVVCPTTVLTNWDRELQRFAPELKVAVYHGPERSLSQAVDADIVLTTYGIVRRDIDLLDDEEFCAVIADEAQHMKNPRSGIARAVRKLDSPVRFSLTGTPIENRLLDLWSLLDWSTPGLLGNQNAFQRNIAVPVERDRDPEVTDRFAQSMQPFVLRRKKTDKDIAPDLPPKTETDHSIILSKEQAGLYQAVVETAMEEIAQESGIARRGLILKLITSLKQVCNHPGHYLGTGLEGESGKLDACDELVDSIIDGDDSVVVFTQYVQMGKLLEEHFHAKGIDVRFLHGGLSIKQRQNLIDSFQRQEFPLLIASLKAGGTGVNLTAATHVIHYDRWWNPSVENQASDRTWRIGQHRSVQIHRLISVGTVEERVAGLLAAKADLAESVVGGGESWLGDFTDEQLKDLIKFGEST